MSVYLPSFFFYLYGDHRDLHSFPTRRSSDLLDIGSPYSPCRSSAVPSLRHYDLSETINPRELAGGVPVSERSRSEEHTSELQSRRELVCRLLLEKKNRSRSESRTVQINAPG